jgi:Family of unknown function (DUF5946)
MVPDVTGPVHAYIHAAPGCWALYSGLEDWKVSLAVCHDAPTLIQHLVDSYAVQHADNHDRRNRQSVAVHLMSLCASLEQGIPGIRLRQMIGTWARREYPLLLPRPDAYQLTARDLADAAGQDRPRPRLRHGHGGVGGVVCPSQPDPGMARRRAERPPRRWHPLRLLHPDRAQRVHMRLPGSRLPCSAGGGSSTAIAPGSGNGMGGSCGVRPTAIPCASCSPRAWIAR